MLFLQETGILEHESYSVKYDDTVYLLYTLVL